MATLVDDIARLRNLGLQFSALKAQIDARLPQELVQLPGRFGYSSVDLFLEAVRAAHSKAALPAQKKDAGRGRVKVTPALRTKIVSALQKSGATDRRVADTFGISTVTVWSIKKQAGLVRSRRRGK